VPGVDLPTMAEAANIPEFDIAPVWGVLLPAGAPAPVVAKLESWFAQIMTMEDTKRFLSLTHGAPFPGGAKELAAFIPKEIKKWEELARLAKIVPQ
jgi:tripartite-type tricarboxylate transporter receptor subunit TctC